MKTILYMATSLDGFIAKSDGDSDWVTEADTKFFEKMAAEIGCIIVGKSTFDQYHGEIYPMPNIQSIVVTTKTDLAPEKDVHFATSPQDALKRAESLGFQTVMLVGGGNLNGAFLKENLIHEMYINIYPFVFGEGIRIFGTHMHESQFTLIESYELGDGVVQLHYLIRP